MDATTLLSGAALVISVIAIVLNARGISAASKSADEAERSAIAAEDSVEIAQRERDRAVERSDVVFVERRNRKTPGLRTYVNTGHDTAYRVEAVTFVNGVRKVSEHGDIISGDSFEVDLTAEHAAAKADADRRSASAAPGIFIASVAKFHATTRVSWISFHGTPGIASF